MLFIVISTVILSAMDLSLGAPVNKEIVLDLPPLQAEDSIQINALMNDPTGSIYVSFYCENSEKTGPNYDNVEAKVDLKSLLSGKTPDITLDFRLQDEKIVIESVSDRLDLELSIEVKDIKYLGISGSVNQVKMIEFTFVNLKA